MKKQPKRYSGPLRVTYICTASKEESDAAYQRLLAWIRKIADKLPEIQEFRKVMASSVSVLVKPTSHQRAEEDQPKSIYGRRVRLNTDLTRYHSSLVVGIEGVTQEGGGSCVRGSDNFVSVQFPNVTMDVLWRSIDYID